MSDLFLLTARLRRAMPRHADMLELCDRAQALVRLARVAAPVAPIDELHAAVARPRLMRRRTSYLPTTHLRYRAPEETARGRALVQNF